MSVLRPRLTPFVAYVVAFVIATAGIVVGFLLKIRYTGAIIQTADQVSMAVLGVILAAAILLLAPRGSGWARRDRGADILTERVVPWSDVVDVSFPQGARWARVDLADDEYFRIGVQA